MSIRIVFPEPDMLYKDKHMFILETKSLIYEDHRAMGAKLRAGEITEAIFRYYEISTFDPQLRAITVALSELGLKPKSIAESIELKKDEAEQLKATDKSVLLAPSISSFEVKRA